MMASNNGYASTSTSTWRVVHSRVIIRKAPSTTAPILGFHAQGKVLEGTTQEVAGQPWLKVQLSGADGKDSEGYMLIDGTSVGLGLLLERVKGTPAPGPSKAPASKAKAAAAPKATANGSQADVQEAPKPKSRPKPKLNVEAFSKWIRHPKVALSRFEVVVNMVMVRNLPSTQADAFGVVKKGEFLEGQARDGWLLLDDKGPEALERGEGRWVLLDGKDLGRSRTFLSSP